MKSYFFISALILFGFQISFAQKNKINKEDLKIFPVQNIQIDGDFQDWDKLFSLNSDTVWQFAIGKDQENLYIAVKIIDPILQFEGVRNGISININTEGKKKPGAQLIFPIPDSETIRAMMNQKDLKEEDIRSELIHRSRGYLAKGFPNIVDGLLSFENTYGIVAAAKVSADDLIHYEAKIPLEQLRTKPGQRIAVQILINNRWYEMKKVLAQQQSQQRRYYRGMPVFYNNSTVKSPIKGDTEIWVIDEL